MKTLTRIARNYEKLDQKLNEVESIVNQRVAAIAETSPDEVGGRPNPGKPR